MGNTIETSSSSWPSYTATVCTDVTPPIGLLAAC